MIAGPEIVLFAAIGVFFVAVLLIAAGGYTWLVERGLENAPAAAPAQGPPRISIQDDFLQRVASFVTPSDAAEVGTTRLRLIRAGYRRPSALRVFYLSRAACAFLFSLAGAVAMMFVHTTVPLPLLLLAFLLFPFILGFLAPPLWVDRCAARRRNEAERGFPDMLDMLLVCIEAGQSFDQACRRVAREIEQISKVLFDEFRLMNDELRAGRDRAAVFRDFASRLNVTDINAFVTVLRQSDEFGVSIADALRVYAADMRNKRLMRAEEKANVMPLKLALGSMAFTVPPTMLVMAGPSLLMILRAFGHMGGG